MHVTRDEFINLPAALALGIIWDVASARLRDMPCPSVPRPPKYDGRLSREGGFVWYSELDLDSLEFWQKKNQDGAAAGGEYAERNSKAAKALEMWVTWRKLFPAAQWNGTRGEEKATAALPSRKPVVHKWPDKSGGTSGNAKSSGSTQRGASSEPQDPDDDSYGF